MYRTALTAFAIICFSFAGVATNDTSCLSLLQRHRSVDIATPVAPDRRLTPADWKAAGGQFLQIPPRRSGVQETLYAKVVEPGHEQKCGSPCVAHCIAGQPRDMIYIKGLWKSIRHRLFEQFSDSPVVFALLAMGKSEHDISQPEGTSGYVRTPQEEIHDEDIRPSMEYLGVDRALLLREECTTGECLQKGLRLKCDGKELGLKQLVDEKTGQYSNMCEIQVSRFRDSLELVREYEDEHNMKFDWVTRPRPDVYFTRPVPQARSLDITSVHVSPWAACGYGGMDWFYAIPRKYANTVGEFASSVSCSDYKSSPDIAENCANCPGCECWLAAWMFAQKVPFKKLPWQWFTPAKFCGADCPGDWEVTPQNIMGVDSRVGADPCTRDESGLKCPMLLATDAQLSEKRSVL